MEIKTVFDESGRWGKLRDMIPKNIDIEVKEAAHDISMDAMTEMGLHPERDGDVVHFMQSAFEVGFLVGSKFESENTRNDTCTIRGRTYRLAGPGLEFVFVDMLDKAFDALEALSKYPTNLLRKGRYEQAIESLRSVLSHEEKDAYWVLMSYTIDRNSASK